MGAPHPEQSFLIQMIERRDELEEITTPEAATELHEQIEAELEAVFDSAVAALERGDTQAAAVELVHRRYLQRLHDEVGAVIERLEAD
jgi:molecular chaperone HscB